ncbi:MAG: fibrobacter succinogenes major paralogous domain-containing protein [Fibrobacter sp.]|nr:fibrobacter succinogenes major paralogous domain-containing protein [Fibrobacter sp.]
MNGKIFGNGLIKAGFVACVLALGLVACGDGESSNGPSNNHENTNISSVESEDDMPSCTESREGFVNFINGTKEGFVCKNRRWDHYDMIADVEENLPGCTGSREGLSAYLYEEDRELNCVEGSWDVVGEVASSSSSVIPSSSSSVIPGTDPGSPSSSSEKDDSSSSVAPSSSSVILSSSSEESSSSVASSSSARSSSSVASSSSEKSSSSVASSSSAKSSSSSVISGSSSSVIPSEVEGSSSSFKANWAYLNPNIDYGEFTDERDGQVYKTVKIGYQTWMAENLNYAYTGVKYNYDSYTSDSTSWCYENKASNCDKYGRLYTWSAVMDSAAQFSVNAGTKCGYGKTCTPNRPHRGICPEGWHVPTKQENSTLLTYIYIDGSSFPGSLRSMNGWGGSENGTDMYGFSALPAGFMRDSVSFDFRGYVTFFWTASEDSSYRAWSLGLNVPNFDLGQSAKDDGRSLRCLKD